MRLHTVANVGITQINGIDNVSRSPVTFRRPGDEKDLSVSDFIAFGERYGIDCRFPALPQYTQSSPPYFRDIEEIALPGGFALHARMFT